ncbi:SDR family oxidoreductase [Achromobacter deleyi]|uniref:SDR family oxidoreductase n=1 Tax=Achromobacter deleyi TaxID=1353891 RepID=UPI001466AEFD|nr:SDR family oxidoreductase [Achromobacter deleyi]CAB3889743.1 Aurachin B dehydrogenase [Achromobacter deleyi]
MRIFLTGATGFIGSKIVPELIAAGHQVLGLSRSEAGAQQLRAAGAEVYQGTIEAPDGLRRGAADCDGVIHTAFDHDFDHFVANCEKDCRVILALGDALQGSARPLIITSATPMGVAVPGEPATEDYFNPDHPNPRKASELAAEVLLSRGINVSVVRLSQIHDARKQGLVTELVARAREKGVSAYVGDGTNPWSAAHVSDTARLYRAVLEKGVAGARYHATAEGRIPFIEIAQAIGRRFGVPAVSVQETEAAAHFGWLARFAGHDMSASSVKTRERLQWQPVGPGLLASLAAIRE